VKVDGEVLNAGDGAAWTTDGPIIVLATSAAEILLFDMTVSDMTN